jgi:hypothetical protein
MDILYYIAKWGGWIPFHKEFYESQEEENWRYQRHPYENRKLLR